MKWCYYNEIDEYCCAWIKNLIVAKLIMDGEIDSRPIQDVKPYEVSGFIRCHFYAGIAGWDCALTLANWPVDRAVWTGSNPCQPFSTAGKRLQFDDERHLWPFWHYLISVCRPPIIFGEQVANGAGAWLDLVFADLESQGYAIGAALLPAAGVGAPHMRNRNWFVAHTERIELRQQSGRCGRTNGAGSPFAREHGAQRYAADPGKPRLPLSQREELRGPRWRQEGRATTEHNWWAIEPEVGRVAHGIPGRVGRLRAYGNAIVPQVAAEFIKAYLDCRP